MKLRLKTRKRTRKKKRLERDLVGNVRIPGSGWTPAATPTVCWAELRGGVRLAGAFLFLSPRLQLHLFCFFLSCFGPSRAEPWACLLSQDLNVGPIRSDQSPHGLAYEQQPAKHRAHCFACSNLAICSSKKTLTGVFITRSTIIYITHSSRFLSPIIGT